MTQSKAEVEVRLDRILLYGMIAAAAAAVGSLWWGWQAAVSAATGSAAVLLAFSLTRNAVAGLQTEDPQLRRKLGLRILGRLLLLGICLYAMLQAPWTRFIPLTAGLSVLMPAIIVEMFVNAERS